MKIIQTLLLLIFLTSSLISQDYLENTALVRFKYFQKNETELNRILSEYGAKISRRIMPLDASLSYGSNTQFKTVRNSSYDKILKAEEPLLRTFVIEFDGSTDSEKFCYYLMKNNDQIEVAEPYYLNEIQGYTPNDPLVANQEDALTLIRAFDAWEVEKGNPDIVIGISDNGIQQSHEDLKDNIKLNTSDPINGLDDDGNGYIDDYNGFNLDGWREGELPWNTTSSDNHGTFVAGIAGADFDNNKGVAGIGGMSSIFPIRIGSADSKPTKVIYSYESIIYAGVRKFSVLNCSWGRSKNYSSLEKSVIDYAIANDVAIITSSGNTAGGQERTTKFYPAGYKGVLGVGAVTGFDGEIGSSTLGTHARIMAPATGNYTTDIDRGQGNPYSNLTAATSYSSPVVAGAVAIARSKYPNLDAIQSIEFVRQCVDDISDDLFFYKDITPGRLNMFKIVTTDPMSIPGITIEEIKFYDNSGAEQTRFSLGDTVSVDVKILNVLGNAENLEFKLSRAYPEFPAIIFIDSLSSSIDISTNETETIGKFKFVINNNYNDKIIFRLNIKDDKEYKDFVLFDKDFYTEITTFENESIKFSISDLGTFGFESGNVNSEREGFGFINKSLGDGLFKSGVFITENELEVVNSLPLAENESRFYPLKRFYNPIFTNSMITANPFAATKAKLDQSIELPKKSPWVRIKVDITDSLNLGSQYSVGYELDWDVGLGNGFNHNTTAFLESARPSSVPFNKFAAIYTKHVDSDIAFGSAMYSEEPDAVAQATGYDRSAQSYNSLLLINSLKNGKVSITNDIADIYNIVGIRFNNPFDTYEQKTCYLCVSAASDTNKLAFYLQECASGLTSVETSHEKNIDFNSTHSSFSINSVDYIRTEIYNLEGRLIREISSNNFNLMELEQGVYLVRIEFEESFVVRKLSIVR